MKARYAGIALGFSVIAQGALWGVEPSVQNRTEVKIDLAKVEPTSKPVNYEVSPGDIKIILENKVPAERKYTVKARLVRTLDPGLQLPDGVNIGAFSAGLLSQQASINAKAGNMGLAAANPAAACSNLGSPFNALRAATSEAQVPSLVKALKAEVKQCDESDLVKLLRITCPSNPTDAVCSQVLTPLEKSLRDAVDLLSKTTETLEMPIEPNEDLEFSVVSTSTTAQPPESRWDYRFFTPGDKRWFVSYGFAVSADDNQSFYTKPVEGQDGKFEILEKADSKEQLLTPAVFFNANLGSWKSIDWLAAGGLGVNSDSISIFAGLGLSVYKNLSLLVGATVRETERLDGRYHVGQVVGENLESGALGEETYRTFLFLSLGFRFGSPPSTHEARKE